MRSDSSALVDMVKQEISEQMLQLESRNDKVWMERLRINEEIQERQLKLLRMDLESSNKRFDNLMSDFTAYRVQMDARLQEQDRRTSATLAFTQKFMQEMQMHGSRETRIDTVSGGCCKNVDTPGTLRQDEQGSSVPSGRDRSSTQAAEHVHRTPSTKSGRPRKRFSLDSARTVSKKDVSADKRRCIASGSARKQDAQTQQKFESIVDPDAEDLWSGRTIVPLFKDDDNDEEVQIATPVQDTKMTLSVVTAGDAEIQSARKNASMAASIRMALLAGKAELADRRQKGRSADRLEKRNGLALHTTELNEENHCPPLSSADGGDSLTMKREAHDERVEPAPAVKTTLEPSRISADMSQHTKTGAIVNTTRSAKRGSLLTLEDIADSSMKSSKEGSTSTSSCHPISPSQETFGADCPHAADMEGNPRKDLSKSSTHNSTTEDVAAVARDSICVTDCKKIIDFVLDDTDTEGGDDRAQLDSSARAGDRPDQGAPKTVLVA